MPRFFPKVTLGLITAMGLAVTGHAGDLAPETSPAPTMKTLDQVEARIPLVPTPDTFTLTIDTPGSYYLTGDLSIGLGELGILIEVSDVTLDLNGYTLQSKPGVTPAMATGIDSFTGTDRIRIHNGRIAGFESRGIMMDGSDNVTLENLIITGPKHEGVVLGNAAEVYNCQITGMLNNTASTAPVTGLIVGASSIIRDCILDGIRNQNSGETAGIRAGEGSLLTGNVIRNVSTFSNLSNPTIGIHLSGVGHVVGNTLSDITADRNAGLAIGIRGTSGRFEDNTLSEITSVFGPVTAIRVEGDAFIARNSLSAINSHSVQAAIGIEGTAPRISAIGNTLHSINGGSEGTGIVVTDQATVRENQILSVKAQQSAAYSIGIKAGTDCHIEANRILSPTVPPYQSGINRVGIQVSGRNTWVIGNHVQRRGLGNTESRPIRLLGTSGYCYIASNILHGPIQNLSFDPQTFGSGNLANTELTTPPL